MKAHLDMTRNVPDFILQQEGAKMQDFRFVVLKKLPLWRVLFIKLIVKIYDRQKEYLRRKEEEER